MLHEASVCRKNMDWLLSNCTDGETEMYVHWSEDPTGRLSWDDACVISVHFIVHSTCATVISDWLSASVSLRGSKVFFQALRFPCHVFFSWWSNYHYHILLYIICTFFTQKVAFQVGYILCKEHQIVSISPNFVQAFTVHGVYWQKWRDFRNTTPIEHREILLLLDILQLLLMVSWPTA